MNITDARIRQIENEQAALPGATRNNLTIRTVRAVLAEMGVDASTIEAAADGDVQPASIPERTDSAAYLARRFRDMAKTSRTLANDDSQEAASALERDASIYDQCANLIEALAASESL
ncbi:hypothetical protein [Paraburkholderia hospita]|uniref:hypothetical protein n=1 Tax=Paraburkholderia TaxID=1822464 RepID=UPI0010566D3B|nr:hypothetical protein [Paraburkholderia hospita]